jgi:hypothetical protein
MQILLISQLPVRLFKTSGRTSVFFPFINPCLPLLQFDTTIHVCGVFNLIPKESHLLPSVLLAK